MKRSEKNTLQHPGPAHAMANPCPRETFVIPGDAGQVARTINMALMGRDEIWPNVEPASVTTKNKAIK